MKFISMHILQTAGTCLGIWFLYSTKKKRQNKTEKNNCKIWNKVFEILYVQRNIFTRHVYAAYEPWLLV